MTDISFVELYRKHAATKEAAAVEDETKEAADVEVTESQQDELEVKEATVEEEEMTEDEVKTAAAEWLEEVTPDLAELAEKVASVIDSEDDRTLFGQCLDSVVLFKTAGLLKQGHGETAHSLVKMANELYRTVRDI